MGTLQYFRIVNSSAMRVVMDRQMDEHYQTIISLLYY